MHTDTHIQTHTYRHASPDLRVNSDSRTQMLSGKDKAQVSAPPMRAEVWGMRDGGREGERASERKRDGKVASYSFETHLLPPCFPTFFRFYFSQ